MKIKSLRFFYFLTLNMLQTTIFALEYTNSFCRNMKLLH